MATRQIKIQADAFEWVKQHKKYLFLKFADFDSYPKDPYPTTVFMAGSPGAGKTEFSRRLAEGFKQKPVIIDADEIRKIIPGYTGKKAFLFQKAATKGVNLLYDYVCKNGLNVIIDGTFAYAQPVENIKRSLKYNRNIEIYFLHQNPIVSWKFTKVRERKEFRNVPKDVFINAYLKSIENVTLVKKEFGNKIKLNLVIKDFTKSLQTLHLNTSGIEKLLPKLYTGKELTKILN
ncbi:zeta toxin family protein [Candidatus Curtissbacteria bacterium]|nr:zeta toxin family protein [Candidatus Curtissbacteria bacterium]